MGQPAITCFSVMAFLSAGHLPGEGPYGKQIDRAIEYVLSCQKRDGLFSCLVPGPTWDIWHTSHAAIYNHGIAGVTLCEVYGMAAPQTNRRVSEAIKRGLALAAAIQDRMVSEAVARGGWRYLRPAPKGESDLSSTSWQLMFYRSARNAGFNVPSERIDRAMRFVIACFDSKENTFHYDPLKVSTTRALNGVGILALTHGGRFDHEMAWKAGDWILAHPYRDYSYVHDDGRWFHYGLFYTVPAMYMLGGPQWQQFFPTTVDTMLRYQNPDGSWAPDGGEVEKFGNTYTTAMVITALNTPNQLLPIMQR